MIQFAYTIQYVPDVTAAISFYEKAFGFQRKFIAPNNEYGELITGNTTLSFGATSLLKTYLKNGFTESHLSNKPFGIEIGFTTDNVEATFKHAVENGAIPEASPELKAHGQTVAYVRDLNGFLIEICSPMS